MRLWLCFLMAVCFWAGQAIAKSPERPVTLIIGDVPVVQAHAGDSVMVVIPVQIAKGYHVNANPASSDDYIPLELALDSTSDFHPGTVLYPQGKTWRLEGSEENLRVYGGEVQIRIPVVVDRSAAPGEKILKGTVNYQACDNQVCFLPESRPLQLRVDILSKK